jgi:hypothetical protein
MAVHMDADIPKVDQRNWMKREKQAVPEPSLQVGE